MKAMHRMILRNFSSQISSCTAPRTSPILRPDTRPIVARPCDVFINHRGADTKHNIAGLLYDHLTHRNIKAFLDQKTMKPGDKIFETIDSAIRNCRIGIALFSPRYCESYFCLHELTLMVESGKKVIPIFFDVKPSDLRIDEASGSQRQIDRFWRALLETRFSIGPVINSRNGNWSKLVNQVGEIVMDNLKEGE